MKSKAKKVISLILAVSMAFQMAVTSYAEAGVDFSDVFDSENDITLTEEEYTELPKELIGELEDKRTENTKHFLYSDGTVVAAQYDTAVHYLDENGKWQDIDNSLIEEAATDDEDDFAGYANKENDVKIKFSNGNASGKFFKYEKDGCKLTWGLDKADLNGKFSIDPEVISETENEYALDKINSSVRYNSVMEDVDIAYEISGSNIKENIIINDKLSSYSFTFDIKAKKLELELCEDGSISVTKEDGATFAHIPAPFMYDSNNVYSTDVSFSLEEYKDDRYYLTVTADEEWMNEEGREFPVVIDPAIVQNSSSVSSSFVSSRLNLANYNSLSRNIVGYDSTYQTTKAYFKLTLPELEKSDMVVDAQFNLYQVSAEPASFTASKMYVYRINDDWNPATLNWENRPVYQLTKSDYTDFNTTTGRKSINITGMVREWYNGVDNYGFALAADDANGSVSFAKNTATGYEVGMLPYVVVTYRSNKGLEGYWSYHTASASRAGTANIHDFTGNIVFTNTIVADSGNRMPLSLGIIYDGFRAKEQFTFSEGTNSERFTAMNFGLGWKLSLEECILPVTDGDIADAYKYVYVDSDGTEHYFYEDEAEDGSTVYLDEDGLGLTLTLLSSGGYRLTDKGDNYRQFNSSGLLSVISDANSNKITLTYTSGRITNVTDGAGRSTVLTYNSSGYLTSVKNTASKTTSFTYDTNGNLTKVTYPDSTYAQYTYNADGMLTEAYSSEDGYKLCFTYTKFKKYTRVTAYEEKAKNSSSAFTAGQSVKIEYGINDLYTVYTSMGKDNTIDTADDIRTVYVFDDFGRTVSSYSTDKDGKKLYGAGASTYESAEKSGKTNKISTQSVIGGVNPNLLTGHQCESTTGWTNAYIGANNPSLSRTVDSETKYLGLKSIRIASGQAISGSYNGYKQTVYLEAQTEYILSGYIFTEDIDGVGAYLAISGPTDSEIAVSSEHVTGTTDKTINGGWQRVSLSYTAPVNETYTIYFGLENCTGTAYFDCLQLEKSEYLSNANLLENAGMESASNWTVTGNCTVSTGLDGNGLAITGNPDSNCSVSQEIILFASANTTFVLSGWVKASSVKLTDNRRLRLRAQLYYANSTVSTYTTSFLSSTTDWQFASLNIVPRHSADIVKIVVYCDYDHNCNTAIFDNISLIKDTVKSYTYDDEGNTISAVDKAQNKSTFEYQDNDLVKQNNPTGYSYGYTYDEKHNLLTASSENNVEYSFTYDNFGNPLTMSQTNANKTVSIDSSATYTTNGNYLATLTDARGNTSAYSYNTTTGLLSKFTDALDNRTIYAYNGNNNRLTKVTYDRNKSNSSDTEDTAVSYAYSKGRLGTITHNGFNYGFTYDDFGNMLTTTVGNNTLVTNTYKAKNGLLTKSAYGNGYNVLYLYDELNRVTAEKRGSDPNIYYYYDNNGNLSGLKGGQGGIEYKYEYDFIGRLVRSFATKDSANYLTTQVKYDDYSRLSRQKFILSDGTEQSYQYFYTTKDSLIGGVALPYSRTLNYTYDSLNRPLTKTITGGTASISERYTYRNGTGTGKTTHLVSKITYSDDSYLQYGHDALNNIIAVFDETGKSVTYEYDGLGQLIRENNPYSNATYTYTYDKGGNITSYSIYPYTTSTLGTATTTKTYTYGDSTWKDKLTNYNGTAITYDSIGNPLNYRNGTLGWSGRQLKAYTNTSGTTTLYTYNSDGVRIGKKSVYQGNTSETSYVVSGTQILSETKGSNTIYYIYDDKGLPLGLVYNGVTYIYRKNVQGDIIAILNSAGNEVVNYTYNAWGMLIGMSGSAVATVGQANPFRYRGYYYDTETGYYYLNSRYYDPTTGRFLNADSFVSTGQGVLGTNMFAYCGNNPVNRVDPNGMLFIETLILAGLVSGDVFGAGATSVISDGPEVEHAHPIIRPFITVKSGSSVSETITSVGDSSKPISVYAEERVDSPLESSAGLKLNLFGCTLNVSVGLSRTGVGLTLPNGGEQTQTHFIGADLTEFKVGYEVSVTKPIDSNKTNVEESDFTNVGVSGRTIAAIAYLFSTGTPGPFLLPIPTR